MKGKRDIAARALCRAGAIGLASRVRARPTRSVTILAYHRVLDVPVEDDFPFDIELVSATVRDFAAQMAYVREHYRPATFETVIAHLDRGEQPPRGTVIVTFDDGFADNYENAFPVLRSLGMPATIFLATGYLDRGDTYWYERLAHAVMRMTGSSGSISRMARNSAVPSSPSVCSGEKFMSEMTAPKVSSRIAARAAAGEDSTRVA